MSTFLGSPDTEARLQDEYSRLVIGINELKTEINKYYLNGYSSYVVPGTISVETLLDQLSSMQKYKHSLERTARELGVILH